MRRALFPLILALAMVAGGWLYLSRPVAQAQGTNRVFTVLSSAARTATTSSSDYTNLSENLNVRGAYITLDVTAISGSPSIVLSIQAKDYTSGKYESVLTASAAVVGTGTHTYLVYPGAGSAAADVTQSVSFPLPPMWRITVTHANTNTITYSVNALLLN